MLLLVWAALQAGHCQARTLARSTSCGRRIVSLTCPLAEAGLPLAQPRGGAKQLLLHRVPAATCTQGGPRGAAGRHAAGGAPACAASARGAGAAGASTAAATTAEQPADGAPAPGAALLLQQLLLLVDCLQGRGTGNNF
jgi:hypothetical protein